MISLQDVTGLWRRTRIAWPDGRTDAETEVLWLQGPRHYADLRLPGGRRAGAQVHCLRDLDWTALRRMARQEGFFGSLDIANSVANWHRCFDYRPDTGLADRGALAFEDGILVERGIDMPYVEHWLREAGTDNAMALSLATEAGIPGCLVVAGDAFIYARGRAVPLPFGGALDQLIDGAASLNAAQDLFDCEISFGHRKNGGRGGGWRIDRSSHGFREGALLSPALDGANGFLFVNDVTREGVPIERAWRIAEYESVPDAPLSSWFGPDGVQGAPPNATTESPGAPQ